MLILHFKISKLLLIHQDAFIFSQMTNEIIFSCKSIESRKPTSARIKFSTSANILFYIFVYATNVFECNRISFVVFVAKCHNFFHLPIYNIYIYIMLVIIMQCISSNQLGKYQVKDMNVYIEPLIDELIKLGMTSLCMMYLNQYDKGNFNFMQCLYGQYMMPQD